MYYILVKDLEDRWVVHCNWDTNEPEEYHFCREARDVMDEILQDFPGSQVKVVQDVTKSVSAIKEEATC